MRREACIAVLLTSKQAQSPWCHDCSMQAIDHIVLNGTNNNYANLNCYKVGCLLVWDWWWIGAWSTGVLRPAERFACQ